MARQASTPQELARRLGCETDDVLIMLWDAGIDYPTSPTSLIRSQDVTRAELACGLAPPKQKTQIGYWLALLDLDRSEFIRQAGEKGISIGPNARKLPKGALAKLERGLIGGRFATRAKALAATVDSEAKIPERFVWQDVGHARDSLQYLTAEDIESVHFAIAEDFRDSPDPISPAGVRSPNLLESAASRPITGLGDSRKYSTVELAGAALLHSVIHNHPFYNGNKRTGLVATMSFLDRNGLTLTCDQNELFRWTIRVASHGLNREGLSGDKSDIEVVEMARWIASHSRLIDRGERVITWKVLRRRLAAFDCEITQSGNRGGRITVTREVTTLTRKLFGPRESRLERRYALPYGGDGRQVGRGHLKELRKEMQLSEEDGVDSAQFYGNDSAPIDEFISIYRKTLSRLAKV